jgi:multiple sugar transport system substrate-binding protein
MIPKGTSAEKREAAFAFMKYWLSDDVLKEWSLRNGFPVWSKTLQARSDIQNDKVLADISKATEIGRSYNLGYALASQIDRDSVVPMFDSVIGGSSTPEAALKAASDKLDAILD